MTPCFGVCSFNTHDCLAPACVLSPFGAADPATATMRIAFAAVLCAVLLLGQGSSVSAQNTIDNIMNGLNTLHRNWQNGRILSTIRDYLNSASNFINMLTTMIQNMPMSLPSLPSLPSMPSMPSIPSSGSGRSGGAPQFPQQQPGWPWVQRG